MRKALIVNKEGSKLIDFIDIKKGDVFSIFEPDGSMVWDKEVSIFEATKDGYLNDENIPTVMYIPWK